MHYYCDIAIPNFRQESKGGKNDNLEQQPDNNL